MMTVNKQAPISPSALLQKLITTQYQKCPSEKQRIKQQRDTLLALIGEYEGAIRHKLISVSSLNQLIQIRANLRLELQALRNQRQKFDLQFANQVNSVKMTPVQIRGKYQQQQQLILLRQSNTKMDVRLNDMEDYANKLQQKIRFLEQKHQNQVNQREYSINRVRNQNKYDDLNWREKIKVYKKQQQIHSAKIRTQLQLKEKDQNIKIQNRNRIYY